MGIAVIDCRCTCHSQTFIYVSTLPSDGHEAAHPRRWPNFDSLPRYSMNEFEKLHLHQNMEDSRQSLVQNGIYLAKTHTATLQHGNGNP